MFRTTIGYRLEDALSGLMAPPRGLEFDYSKPEGEAAIVPPDSVSWRIFKNPVSLFIGGVAAVILELAEPSVRAGVWDHSTFRKDAPTRLRRTGAAAMMTVYGPRSQAERMIARVVKMHQRVHGTTPEGVDYDANDPRLLNWVQATASFGFIEAYSLFVSTLTQHERSQAYAEGAEASRLYGATEAPQSVEEWQETLHNTAPLLQRSDVVYEFIEIMNNAAILPKPFRFVQRLLVRAAIDLLPIDVSDKLGLGSMTLSAVERGIVRAMARTADRIPLRNAPPAQASVRMGLQSEYLYKA